MGGMSFTGGLRKSVKALLSLTVNEKPKSLFLYTSFFLFDFFAITLTVYHIFIRLSSAVILTYIRRYDILGVLAK